MEIGLMRAVAERCERRGFQLGRDRSVSLLIGIISWLKSSCFDSKIWMKAIPGGFFAKLPGIFSALLKKDEIFVPDFKRILSAVWDSMFKALRKTR